MDELALLRDFRLEDAAANGAREHARAAVRASAERQRRRKRRGFVVLVLVGAAIIAGAAYGIVRGLIVGSPAPPEVREQPARFGHSAELIPVPHPEDPRLDEARVAAVLESTVGTVYVFSSPNATGLCASTWIEGNRGYQGRLNIASVCGRADQSFFGFGSEPFRDKAVRLLYGRAGDGVARVELRFADKTVDVPLTGRYFLAEFPGPANELPTRFLSYGADGKVLEEHGFGGPLHAGAHPAQQPHRVTAPHEVATIDARGGAERVTLLVARASDGGYCQTVRSDRTPTNSGCSVPRPEPRDIDVSAMNFGGAPGGILLLVGPVGSKIATLELRYQDGRLATVPLHGGWALYEVAPSDYVAGRRPTTLVGRDSSGRQIASSRLPWATSGG
jgi:hypothetical protein